MFGILHVSFGKFFTRPLLDAIQEGYICFIVFFYSNITSACYFSLIPLRKSVHMLLEIFQHLKILNAFSHDSDEFSVKPFLTLSSEGVYILLLYRTY